MRGPGRLDQEPVVRAEGARTALVLACAGLAACGAEGSAPPEPAVAEADSIVSAWVADGTIPGAVLLVGRADEVVWHRAYGWAQAYAYGSGQYGRSDGIEGLEHPVPMSPGTVFDLASVTKVMATTMALMRLVDDGSVDLDAPVGHYLEDFEGRDRDRITVRHLLTHTSGLPQWLPTYYHASTPDAAYDYVRRVPPAWPVGEGRHYSDLGFMVLGRLVEEVGGRPLDRFVAEEIYEPLGLTEIGFRPRPSDGRSTSTPARVRPAPTKAGAPSPLAGGIAATSHGNPFERRMVHDPDFGYRIDGDPDAWDGWRRRTLVGEVNDGNAFHAFGGVAGHAGLFAPASELLVLLRLLLDEGTIDGRRLLSPETVRTFLQPAVAGQALGWQLPDHAPSGSFGHTGFTGTFVLGVPDERLAIVLLTNRQNVGVDGQTQYPDVDALQRAVTRALAGMR